MSDHPPRVSTANEEAITHDDEDRSVQIGVAKENISDEVQTEGDDERMRQGIPLPGPREQPLPLTRQRLRDPTHRLVVPGRGERGVRALEHLGQVLPADLDPALAQPLQHGSGRERPRRA